MKLVRLLWIIAINGSISMEYRKNSDNEDFNEENYQGYDEQNHQDDEYNDDDSSLHSDCGASEEQRESIMNTEEIIIMEEVNPELAKNTQYNTGTKQLRELQRLRQLISIQEYMEQLDQYTKEIKKLTLEEYNQRIEKLRLEDHKEQMEKLTLEQYNQQMEKLKLKDDKKKSTKSNMISFIGLKDDDDHKYTLNKYKHLDHNKPSTTEEEQESLQIFVTIESKNHYDEQSITTEESKYNINE